MLFFMSFGRGNELASSQDVPGAGVCPTHSALKHNGKLKIVGRSDLPSQVVVDSLALIKSQSGSQDQLPAMQELTVDQSVGADPRNKETASCASPGGDLCIPVLGERSSNPETVKPAAVIKASLPREFAVEDVVSSRDRTSQIEVIPVRIATAESAMAPAYFDIAGTV